MKNITFLFLFALVHSMMAQTTWTVSNNPDIPGEFSNVQDANDDARVQAGDILLVSRSPNEYFVTLSKQLTIIGEGYNLDPRKEYAGTQITMFNYINFATGASGSDIQGAWIEDMSLNSSSQRVDDVRIRKNRIARYLTFNGADCRNWVIEENVFTSTSGSEGIESGGKVSNILIQNNIFGRNTRVEGFTNGGAIVMHNVFVTGTGNVIRAFSADCRNLIISSNIFVNRSFHLDQIENVIANNIAYQMSGDLDLTTLDQDNLNVDPGFVNWDLISDPGTGDVLPYDFRVADGSPAVDAATDGENIGLTSEVVPYESPIIPYITRVKVLNPVVPQSGSLNVQLKVEYPNER